MRKYKSTWMGISVLLLLVFVVFLNPTKALAADQPFNGSTEWRNAQYTMNDKSKIIVSFPTHSDETFNNDGSDKKYNPVTSSAGICSGSITFNSGQSLSSHPIKATISVKFANSQGTPSCVNGGDSYTNNSITIINNTTGGGSTPGSTGPSKITFNGQTYTQLSTAAGQNRFYGLSIPSNPPGGDCYGGSVLVLASVPTTTNQPVEGTILPAALNGAGGGELSTQVKYWPNANIPLDVASVGRCHYNSNADSGDHVLVNVKADGTATFKGCSKGDTACQPTSNTGAGTGSTAPPSCESNFNSPFAWAICPAFSLADSAAGTFNSFIEGQLCFKTTNSATSSTGSTFVCSGNNNLDNGVHNAWAIFKNIASALIVIVMIIMVISQAISAGPLDAYTIRKMLPKLVAAVIIMQISWPMLKYAIDLSNDAGNAIGHLLMAPFGGPSNLSLDRIIGTTFQGIDTTGQDTFSLFTIIAAGAAAFIVGIPTLFLMALYVVLALLIAFMVLVFRKILIIFLVILSPLAFIAWVMPGMDRYWKLWKDNFVKMLLMFPMIMGLLSAGRIFASITAGNSSVMELRLSVAHLGPLPVPYFGSVTSFADLIIIIAAFFAPYFLLPQTYKWGGAAMGSIAKGVQKGVERGAKPAKDYLKFRQGLEPWRQAREARKAEVTRRAKIGFTRGIGSTGMMGSIRRARLGGVPRPTLKGIREEGEIRGAITRSAQEKLRQEELKEQELELANEEWTWRDPKTGKTRTMIYSEMAREDKLLFLEEHAKDANIDDTKREVLLAQMAGLRGGVELMRVRNWMFANGKGAEYNRAMQHNFDSFNSTSAMFTQGATQKVMDTAKTAYDSAIKSGLTVDDAIDSVGQALAASDMEYMAGQNDQTIATQSGSGWTLYQQQARYAGANPKTGRQFIDEAKDTYNRILTSGQPYAGQVNPKGHELFSPTAGPPTRPSPAPGVATPTPTGVRAGSRTEWAVTRTDSQLLTEIKNAGGWGALSPIALRRIYDYRTGSVKDQAEAEMRTRGMIP